MLTTMAMVAEKPKEERQAPAVAAAAWADMGGMGM